MDHYSGLAECLGRIEGAASNQALWSSVKNFADRLGYSHVFAADLARLAGGLSSAVIYNDAPTLALASMDREIAHARNPLVQRVLQSDVPFFVSEVCNQKEHVGQPWTQFLDDVVKRGVGLVVPVYRDSKPVAGFNFGGEAPDLSANARSMLQVVAHAAIEKFHRVEASGSNRSTADAPALSTREMQCLRLVAVGNTDAEVGKMLGISPRTVRFHVDSSKTKLGVTTRIQAVAKALRDKVIAV